MVEQVLLILLVLWLRSRVNPYLQHEPILTRKAWAFPVIKLPHISRSDVGRKMNNALRRRKSHHQLDDYKGALIGPNQPSHEMQAILATLQKRLASFEAARNKGFALKTSREDGRQLEDGDGSQDNLISHSVPPLSSKLQPTMMTKTKSIGQTLDKACETDTNTDAVSCEEPHAGAKEISISSQNKYEGNKEQNMSTERKHKTETTPDSSQATGSADISSPDSPLRSKQSAATSSSGLNDSVVHPKTESFKRSSLSSQPYHDLEYSPAQRSSPLDAKLSNAHQSGATPSAPLAPSSSQSSRDQFIQRSSSTYAKPPNAHESGPMASNDVLPSPPAPPTINKDKAVNVSSKPFASPPTSLISNKTFSKSGTSSTPSGTGPVISQVSSSSQQP